MLPLQNPTTRMRVNVSGGFLHGMGPRYRAGMGRLGDDGGDGSGDSGGGLGPTDSSVYGPVYPGEFDASGNPVTYDSGYGTYGPALPDPSQVGEATNVNSLADMIAEGVSSGAISLPPGETPDSVAQAWAAQNSASGGCGGGFTGFLCNVGNVLKNFTASGGAGGGGRPQVSQITAGGVPFQQSPFGAQQAGGLTTNTILLLGAGAILLIALTGRR